MKLRAKCAYAGETKDLEGKQLEACKRGGYKAKTPRANIGNSLRVYPVYQQYSIVLERSCGQRVTGGVQELDLRS